MTTVGNLLVAKDDTAHKTTRPPFMCAIEDDYLAKVSHTFCVTGNIYDFVDNSGQEHDIKKSFMQWYDDNIRRDLGALTSGVKDAGVQAASRTSPRYRIVIFYNSSLGLEFAHSQSRQMWLDAFRASYRITNDDENNTKLIAALGLGPKGLEPQRPDQAIQLLSKWFQVSKDLQERNLSNRAEGLPLSAEVSATIVFTDADALFPAGNIANLSGDRNAIVAMRNWAQDRVLGARNRIVLMSRHLNDIHESIRGELAISHLVRKPNLQDRLEWITNYDTNIRRMVERQNGKPLSVGQNTSVTGLQLAADFDLNEFAIQSAGMNRQQIKDVILASWRNQVPLDFSLVQERKKRALEDEYGGMIDIKEPKFGFDHIGGHDSFKDYCRWHIIRPLKAGDKKQCSKGVLMTGPPGTGKSLIAWALAKEASLNFIEVDLGKVFGGIVGETEKNVRKLFEAIEAASPCIVFIDEIDSVLSSGRSSGGDSGTSARVFNKVMSWFSDPTRQGKVVVLAATNRPDLLDSALIRSQRFSAIIPMLAPAKGDALGRWNILAALTRKLKLVLHPDLINTKDDAKVGLGKLLHDADRVWTGAEMESVLQSSMHKAYRASRLNGTSRMCVSQLRTLMEP